MCRCVNLCCMSLQTNGVHFPISSPAFPVVSLTLSVEGRVRCFRAAHDPSTQPQVGCARRFVYALYISKSWVAFLLLCSCLGELGQTRDSSLLAVSVLCWKGAVTSCGHVRKWLAFVHVFELYVYYCSMGFRLCQSFCYVLKNIVCEEYCFRNKAPKYRNISKEV